MNIRLPVELYSPDQLGIIMLELKDNLNTQRDVIVKTKVTNQASDQPKPRLSGLLMNTLIESHIDPSDTTTMEDLLKQLDAIRNNAPVAHIVLTANPTPALKTRLVKWFRSEINPYALITFATREDIGGGVIVRAGSHIHDLSFRARLIENKTRIAEIFHGVRR